MSSYTTISSDKLSRLIGTANAPTLIDVRIDDEFAADPRLIPGASRRSHRDIQDWAGGLAGQSVVVICKKGQKLSALPHNSVAAETLEGGQVGWTQMELPTVPADKIPKRDARGRTVWVTRSRPKIDRIACPWLIRRFIDPSAVFLFVAPAEVSAVAERFEATPFDVENVFWSHRGELCTFDVMVQEFGLSTPPLDRFATSPPTLRGSTFRRRRRGCSPRRSACRGCMTTTSSSCARACCFTTRSTAGAGMPRRKPTTGQRTR